MRLLCYSWPHHATYDFPAAGRPSVPRRFPARFRAEVSAKTIQFKGDPEYSDQELLAAAGLKKGAVLTSAEMNDHSKQLMDTGVFDTLTFKFDGQDLIFLLVPSTTMFPISLETCLSRRAGAGRRAA